MKYWLPLLITLSLTTIKASALEIEPYKITSISFGKPDTRVDLSFKYELVKDSNFFFAYSHKMFWDTDAISRPVTELQFNPEVFYSFKNKITQKNFFDLGYEHLSNGKDGTASRSVNRAYVRFTGHPISQIHLRYFQVTTRVLTEDDQDNPDYYKFHGPVSIKLSFGPSSQEHTQPTELNIEYYNGGRFADDFSKGSLLISSRLNLGDKKLGLALYAMYFNGYGETLINYNQRSESFRVGVAFGGL